MTKEERVIYDKQYYSKNKEKLRIKKKQFYGRNKKKWAQRYVQNKEEEKKRMNEYQKRNKEKIKLKKKQYYKDKAEKLKYYSKYQRAQLTDAYVRNQIKNTLKISLKTINENPELIENYRKQILLKRLIKNKKDGTKNNQ